MKIWAKVRLNLENDAQNLIRAFFESFNSKNSIEIRDKEARIELIFDDDIPCKCIEAISKCEVVEFNCSNVFEKYSEKEILEKNEQKEDGVPSKRAIQGKIDKTTSRQMQHSKQKNEKSEEEKEKPIKKINAKTVNIPQLEEIAKEAKSFEHFVKLVTEWFELDKRKEIFEKLVLVASELDKICWKDLQKAMNSKESCYTESDRVIISRFVSKKLKGYSITLISLLKLMKQYKSYSFQNEQSEENSIEQITEETIIAVKEESSDEVQENTTKNRVRMECMPEIPYFEEILGSVDKTQSIDNRMSHVFNAMGLEKKTVQEQEVILKIASAVVKVKRLTVENNFLREKFSIKEIMIISEFINDFISKYYSDKKVKTVDFLNHLKQIIMSESEIESLAD